MIELIKFWINVLCCWRHDYQWTHNFYGDAINVHNGKRSRWRCCKCGWLQFRDELYEKSKPKAFRIQEPTGPF